MLVKHHNVQNSSIWLPEPSNWTECFCIFIKRNRGYKLYAKCLSYSHTANINENVEYMQRNSGNLRIKNNGKQEVYKSLSRNMGHEITQSDQENSKWKRTLKIVDIVQLTPLTRNESKCIKIWNVRKLRWHFSSMKRTSWLFFINKAKVLP